MSRADAATAAGMERQALRDAVLRYDAQGPAGVRDRPLPGRPPALSEADPAPLFDRIFRGPGSERPTRKEWPCPHCVLVMPRACGAMGPLDAGGR